MERIVLKSNQTFIIFRQQKVEKDKEIEDSRFFKKNAWFISVVSKEIL